MEREEEVIEKKSLMGIKIIGIIEILFGIFGFIGIIFSLYMGAMSHFPWFGRPDDPIEAKRLCGVFFCVFGFLVCSPFFLFLFSGFGLLKLRNWAKIMSLILFPLTIVAFYYLRYPLSLSLFWAIPFILFFAFSLFYLTRSKVKEQFK